LSNKKSWARKKGPRPFLLPRYKDYKEETEKSSPQAENQEELTDMKIPQFDYQKGEFVENIEPKSDVYSRVGKIVAVTKENGKIEVRVKYKEDPSTIRLYIEGKNLRYIVPYSEDRLIPKK